MDAQAWLSIARRARIIAVIRVADVEVGRQLAQAVVAGGVRLVEVTWNSDRPAELVEWLRHHLPNCIVGAGTLLSPDHVKTAIAAGAEFLFTPHVDAELLQIACHQDVPMVAGALTPTEIVSAWQLGAACVKVFPVQSVGGSAYIRSLQGPLGQIPLIPTGGVNLANAHEFLQAGAIAVGLSGDLFPPELVQDKNWEEIAQRVRIFLNQLEQRLEVPEAKSI